MREKKRGPKPKLVDALPRNIMLTTELVEKARRIGGGNMSAGVRKALEEHKPAGGHKP